MNIERKNILLSLAGLGISKFGSVLFTFAIGFFVLNKTSSGTSFAWILALGLIPTIILGPIAGNFADRANKKLLIVSSDILSGIIMFLFLYLSMKNGFNINYIYAATILLAVCSTFLDNTLSAAIPCICKSENLTRVNSARQTLMPIINISVPLIGGILANALKDSDSGMNIFILINGISFILSGISELFIDFNFNGTEKGISKNSFIDGFKEGIHYLKTKPEVYTLMIFALIINFFLSSVNVTLPRALLNEMKLSGTLYGIIMAIFGMGQVVGGIYVGTKNLKMSQKLFKYGIFSHASFMILFGLVIYMSKKYLSLAVGIIIIILFLVAVVAMMINTPLGVYFQTTVEREYLGRVISIFGTMATAVMPISYILTGLLVDHIPVWVIVLSTGIASFVTAVFVMINKNLKFLGAEKNKKAA